MRRKLLPLTPAATGEAGPEPHLSHGRVDLQDLLVTFDLAHADLAGELGGGGASSLQGEAAEQRLLVAAPHLREGELLQETGRSVTSWGRHFLLLQTRPPRPAPH